MNSNKGIFEGFPAAGSGAGQSFPSPFSAVADDQAARNPFAQVEPVAPFSPFAGGEGDGAKPSVEPGKPARLPERRRAAGENPFQVAEPSEGFGFDPPAGGFAAAPFQAAPAASPFSVVAEEPAVTLQAVPMVQAYQPPAPVAAPAATPAAAPVPITSPFQAPVQAAPPVEPAPAPSAPAPSVSTVAPAPASVPSAPPVVEVSSPFAPAPAAAPVAAPAAEFSPPAAAAPAPVAAPPAIDPTFAAWAPLAPVASAGLASPPPVAPAVAPSPAVALAPAPAPAVLPEAASAGIRQLELRAIFGVERELSADEILQRLRGLAGIRNLMRVGHEELAAFENLRRCLASLAPSGAPMRLLFGNSPVELVREGRVVLAVMTDGSFAPGVRETIMIGARELDRML